MIIRPLDADDVRYALFSWREGHKKAPGANRVPWSYYKNTYVDLFAKILNDPATNTLGAYTHEDKLAGWLTMTPGKRVGAVHWVHVKHELDGKPMRRRGVMTALLDAADLGSRFVYTLQARRDRAQLPDGSMTKSLDETLVVALRERGVSATYIPLKEFLK